MRNLSSRYSVQIAPSAWRGLGKLPTKLFAQIQKELSAIAELASVTPSLVTDAGMPHQRYVSMLQVDTYNVTYEVDPEKRAVTLLEIV